MVVILSFYIFASPVSQSKLRSSFIALSACPECPRGAAEWPVAPLTLRAAVTLHLAALHLGWCGHLATRPGFAAHGPEAIGKSIDTPRPNLESCLPAWLADSPPLPVSPFLTLLLPLSLVMAKWRRCSSHFSTPRCMWISCYRLRNASACQGACSSRGWCICPVNWPPFPPMFRLRGGETAINQILEEDFFPITVPAMKNCWPKITLVHNCCPPHPSTTFMNFFQHTGALGVFQSNNSTTPILPWLILWIISTWIYVNLIRNLSDMNAKITFISRTMINVKGITGSPKIRRDFLSS